MKVRVFRTADEAAHAAASAVAAQLTRKPVSVLGLPTGRTSLAVYDELAKLHEAGEANFSYAHTFNIDEFVGLASNDERSYCAFMQKHLFTRINLPSDHVHFLDGGTSDHQAECARFERDLTALGGLDLLLIGIGGNAHIGFTSADRRIHAAIVHDSRPTRRANASLFGGGEQGSYSLSRWDGHQLMRAIVLVATGRAKSRAVGRCSPGGSRSSARLIPATAPNVEVILIWRRREASELKPDAKP